CCACSTTPTNRWTNWPKSPPVAAAVASASTRCEESRDSDSGHSLFHPLPQEGGRCRPPQAVGIGGMSFPGAFCESAVNHPPQSPSQAKGGGRTQPATPNPKPGI